MSIRLLVPALVIVVLGASCSSAGTDEDPPDDLRVIDGPAQVEDDLGGADLGS